MVDELDFTDAKEWCRRARELLGDHDKKKSAKLLKQRLTKTIGELKTLRKSFEGNKPDLTEERVIEVEQRFLDISAAIKKAVESVPPDDIEVERQSNFLSELKKELAWENSKFFKESAKRKFDARKLSNESPKWYVGWRDYVAQQRDDLLAFLTPESDHWPMPPEIEEALTNGKLFADQEQFEPAVELLEPASKIGERLIAELEEATKLFNETRNKLIEKINDAQNDPNIDRFRAGLQGLALTIQQAQSDADVGKFNVSLQALIQAQNQLDDLKSGKVLFDTTLTNEMKAVIRLGAQNCRGTIRDKSVPFANEVAAFQKPYGSYERRMSSDRWFEALGLIPETIRTAELLNVAAEKFYTAQPQVVAKLKPKTDRALETGFPDWVKKLQMPVVEELKELHDKLEHRNYGSYVKGLVKVAKLADTMILGIEKYESLQSRIKQLIEPKGEDHAARQVTLEPTSLSDARDTALTAARAAVVEAIEKGMIGEAERRLAMWTTQAIGWTTTPPEKINEAHTVLKERPFSAEKIRELLQAEGGNRLLDDVLTGTYGQEPPKDLMAVLFKERFGVELDLLKQNPNKEDETIGNITTKKSKSVKRLYEILALVPESHVKNSDGLKKIERITKNDGGTSSYNSGSKRIKLQCGRQGIDMSLPLGDTKQLPGIEEDCKLANDTVLKKFDWTTLHEIGHAVDDKLGFMAGKMGQADFGGWKATDVKEVAIFVWRHFKVDGGKFDGKRIIKLLTDAPSKPYDDYGDVPGVCSDREWKEGWKKVVDWCYAVRMAQKPWRDGTPAEGRAIAGRIFHESYDGKWVSYAAAARKRGVRGYQFRAPGEWFADLYAAYFSGKLKPSHPSVAWLKDL